jgi:hypothetical protein
LPEDCDALKSGDFKPLILNNDRVTYNCKGKNPVVVPSVVIEKELPAFQYKALDGTVIHKDKSLHSLFLPLYRLLQSFWQNPTYSLSIDTALRNYVTKALAECSMGLEPGAYFELEGIFGETADYYLLRLIAKSQSISLDGNVAPMRNPHHIYKTAWYSNYEVKQVDTYLKMNVKPRHLPRVNGDLTFNLRPNITVSNPQKWHTPWVIPPDSMHSFFETALNWSYTPPTYLSDQELTKQYVSVGMDLIPGCWDHSDVSDTLSLLDAVQKRLFSARDGEKDLWTNQQRWLADLTDVYGPVPEHVRKLLNYKVERGDGKYYYVEDPYWGKCSYAQHRPKGLVVNAMCLGDVYTTMVRETSPILDFIDQFKYDTSLSAFGATKDYMNTFAHNLWDGAFSMYAAGYSSFINRYTYAQMPGPKRQERTRTLDGIMYEPKTGVCQPILALKAELDKLNFEKASRVFMSYGPKSSFLAPDLISIVKKRLSGRLTRTYTLKNKTQITVDCYTFTTPRTSDIEHLFKEMINIDKTPNTIVFGCFSDDSVIAWNLPQGLGYANVDISSCDSSNGPLIFELVYRFLSQLDEESAYYYLLQCKQKIRCENPQNRDQYIFINFPTCFEGSGTALTTLLNTIASALICAGIVEMLISNPDMDMDDCIRQGAALVGHKVTVDHCKKDGQYCVERLQFLKFSPIKTTIGTYVPSRNIGCIVRGLGKIVGDLTPQQIGMTSTSLEWKLLSAHEKFDRYITSIITGYKNEASHPLLDGLRARFPTKIPHSIKYTHCLEADGDYSSLTLDETSLLMRYDVDIETLRQARAVCSELRLGSVVHYPLFYEAMVLDYGMERRRASPLEATYDSMGVGFRSDSGPLGP